MSLNKVKGFINNHENLVNIFADAITYSRWIGSAIIPREYKNCKEEAKAKGIDVSSWCVEDKWAYIILNGGYIIIGNEEKKKPHYLTLAKLRKGWYSLISEYPHNYANIMSENDDSTDHDALIQLALFGEIVYG